MPLQRLGLIGAGAMARTVLEALASEKNGLLEHLSLLVLAEFVSDGEALAATLGRAIAERVEVHTDRDTFLGGWPDLVVECAGHAAVRQHCAAVLAAGIDFLAVSTGALADEPLRKEVSAAALAGGSRLVGSTGAIGGIDILSAARLAGFDEVVYTGRKPPGAWRGTKAEDMLDLTSIDQAVTFFEGDARRAALEFPQNANVAATVALACGSFERTTVRLVADPSIERNVHELAVRSACTDYVIRLEGRPSPTNPKTSLTAGFSLAREIIQRRSYITF